MVGNRYGEISSGRRQIVLNKGRQKFIFRYNTGREDELLDAIIAQAKDSRTSFDWYDAAVISSKLAESLIVEANHLARLLQKNNLENMATD